jgi:hypothetical protein
MSVLIRIALLSLVIPLATVALLVFMTRLVQEAMRPQEAAVKLIRYRPRGNALEERSR